VNGLFITVFVLAVILVEKEAGLLTSDLSSYH
jgi:hypothetical protein